MSANCRFCLRDASLPPLGYAPEVAPLRSVASLEPDTGIAQRGRIYRKVAICNCGKLRDNRAKRCRACWLRRGVG